MNRKFRITVVILLSVIVVFLALRLWMEIGVPADLTGVWKENSDNSLYCYTAIIHDNIIEVFFFDKVENRKSLIWAGSFKAPTIGIEPYKWVSQNDKSRTDEHLFSALHDDTLSFSYENGELCFSFSQSNNTVFVRMQKGDSSVLQ